MDLGRAFRDATVRSYIMSVIYGIEFSSVISACLPRAAVATSGLVDSFDPGLIGITRYQHFIGCSYLQTTRCVKRTLQELGSGIYSRSGNI